MVIYRRSEMITSDKANSAMVSCQFSLLKRFLSSFQNSVPMDSSSATDDTFNNGKRKAIQPHTKYHPKLR